MSNPPLDCVLIVEDDEDDLALLRESLYDSKLTRSIVLQKDGEGAIAFLKRQGKYKDSQIPNLIILDINIPKLSGFEVLKEVKSDPELRHIPIVMLTVSDSEKDIARSYAIGASSYITKSPDYEKFVDVIANMVNYWKNIARIPSVQVTSAMPPKKRRADRRGAVKAPGRRPASPLEDATGKRQLELLYVEDDEDDIDLIRGAFDETRFAKIVHVVRDGGEALAFLRHEGEYENARLPDMVLLDLQIPKMGGFEVLREIKSDPRIKHIPVAILTATDREEDIARAFAEGACSYIIKPSDVYDLKPMAAQFSIYWREVSCIPR